jgi:hypothetical protein
MSQTFFELPPDCYCTSVYATDVLLAYNTRFYGACRTFANFFYLIPILHRFRIIICNWQAALLSVLFNYTPLVIGGTDENKQLTIMKPTQTDIYCNQ